MLVLLQIVAVFYNLGKGDFTMGAMLGEASAAVVTASQLSGITDTLNANLGVLIPVGIAIMGAMIGVSLIPRIVYKFL